MRKRRTKKQHQDRPASKTSTAAASVSDMAASPLVVGRLRGAGGLWFVFTGLWASAHSLGRGTWPVLFLSVPITVLGTLLLVEFFSSGGRTNSPDASGPEVHSSWRMPVWLHLLLHLPIVLTGVFGGALVGALAVIQGMSVLEEVVGLGGKGGFRSLAATVLILPCFFGGAVLGAGQAQRLLDAYVLARCPRCRGSTRCRPGKPYTYHCTACEHVHRTIVSSR